VNGDATGEETMRDVEFGTTGFYPAFEGANRARLAEEMGFDIQGFSENHARAPDCFGEMRDAARATNRVKLACGPVNFLTRNPGVIAAAVLPLQVISKGRVICNLATGDSAAAAAGLRPQRMADMERDMTRLRTYLDGGEVDFGAQTSRIEWADRLAWERIPIQMCCSGPRSIALAARKADRICLGVGTNKERLAWALDIVDEGIAASGRRRDDLRVGIFAPIGIFADRASARPVMRERVSAWAHMQSGRGTDLSQQPEILRRVTTYLRDNYDYRFHRPDLPPGENPNNAACDEEFGEWMGIGGPSAYLVDRMGELVEMGIDFFMTALPMDEREPFAARVMPELRKLRA
jgi:5,10-methylenetetrahydromethanopterin reductase